MTRYCTVCKAELQGTHEGRKCVNCNYTIAKPERFTTKNVVFWSHTHEQFEDEYGKKVNPMTTKALKFIENRCLDYSPDSKQFF